MVKNSPVMQENRVQSLGQEDPLEKGMASPSSILAWRIPWGCKESDMTEQLTLSLVAEHWALGSVGFVVGVRGLWSTGSVVLVHEPSCSEAYGIIPD